MGDLVKNILPSRPRRHILNTERALELSPYCQTTRIRKKSHHYLCKSQITGPTPSICGHQILTNIGQHNLVIALDLLYNDFEMTTAPLLHLKDKNIEKIQQIVTSTKAANMARQTTGQTADLAMQIKKKSDGHQQ